ncbi:hypothetical protein AN960_09885 [Bacillus sp. FJAT-25509]|uniref:hypothetical protein n=1 Tax=Bacillus sp. FJAT-25509 TaxID=1712029 RepID=UPI0006FEA9D2|nr:hypothetical protein [Bacillus sp. FJAT-25509]KQL39265.1 hypothetical protein AN960_09885 [Bacillus sp. FJAT-25509]
MGGQGIALESLSEELFGFSEESSVVKTHGHHTFPKYLSGHPKQLLSKMVDSAHRVLHTDMRKFEDGWLGAKRGYTGQMIIKKYGRDKIIKGLRRFYSQRKYRALLDDFEEAVRFTEGKLKHK